MVGTPLSNGKTNTYPQSDNGTQLRLNKIKRINDFLIAKICKREAMSKTFNKYNVAFDYFNNILLVSLVPGGSVLIASVATIIDAPVGITSPSLSLVFALVMKLLKTFKNNEKRKKHNKIILVASISYIA